MITVRENEQMLPREDLGPVQILLKVDGFGQFIQDAAVTPGLDGAPFDELTQMSSGNIHWSCLNIDT